MKIIVVCYGIGARKIVGARKIGACVCYNLTNGMLVDYFLVFLFFYLMSRLARQLGKTGHTLRSVQSEAVVNASVLWRGDRLAPKYDAETGPVIVTTLRHYGMLPPYRLSMPFARVDIDLPPCPHCRTTVFHIP